MIKKYIKINTISDIKAYLEHAKQVSGDITIRKGKYVVDGKSIMGIFSFDGSTGFTIEYPDTAEEFDNFISNFECVENKVAK
jgi:phosphotransferase system HPr-like phosphotransfer protein